MAAGHTHHVAALKWFEARDDDSIAICRVTQMGLLRLLTNPKVLAGGAHSIHRAWDISNETLADRRVFFEYEPPDLQAVWSAIMKRPDAQPSSWTDAYLAAFSQGHDYEMVTFDRGFRRWSDLMLTVLQ